MANKSNATVLKKRKEIALWKYKHSKEKCEYCIFHSARCYINVESHWCHLSLATEFKGTAHLPIAKILTEKNIKTKCEYFTPIMINSNKRKIYHMSN
jgi:hypothetical protein